MIGVSDAWLEANQQSFLRECFVTVELNLRNETAVYTASAVSPPELEIISDVTDILEDYSFTKFGTLEENLWILDGYTLWFDDSAQRHSGYVGSSLSDNTGTFIQPVVISVTPEITEKNIYGVTLTFSKLFQEYATEFELMFFLDNQLVKNQIVTDNAEVSTVVRFESGEFDRMELRIYKWCLPNRRARIESVLMGINVVFDKTELVEFEISESVSMLDAVLPENIFNFSIDRTKVSYDLDSDDTLSGYFRQRQKVNVEMGIRTSKGIETITGGRYFLESWDFGRGSITGKFTAKGVMSFMTGIYDKGRYNPNGTDYYSLALNVLYDAKEHLEMNFSWNLSETLRNYRTTAPLPVCTWAECLQYIANACGCILSCSRTNVIKIMNTTYTGAETPYHLDNSVLFDYPRLELLQELKSISCDMYSCELGDSEILYQAIHYVEYELKLKIQYSTSGDVQCAAIPYADTENMEIVSVNSYATNTEIYITGSGYITIKVTGKPLKTASSVYTASLSETGSEERLQNPIITNTETAKKACEMAASWLKNRSQETFSSFRADPRLDAGDFVTYRNEQVLISSVKYRFTGMFRGECSGRIGYQPFTLPDIDDVKKLDTILFPDINGDGKADAKDAAIIAEAASNIGSGNPSGLTQVQELLADANRDGIINSKDNALVLEFSSGVGSGRYVQSPASWEQFLKDKEII